MSVYALDNGRFVIASHGSWLPGSYATKAAALYAFQFSDDALRRVERRVLRGEGRAITTDDLRALRASPRPARQA